MWPNNVTEKDLRIDYYRGSGKGGQKRNKTSSACRIVHIPTGIMACAEDSRSQPQNRKNAFLRLADKLIPLMKEAATPKFTYTEAEVRVYRANDRIVRDKRIAGKIYDYYAVLQGNQLDEIIDTLCQPK
jgi:protein subunit release factor A